MLDPNETNAGFTTTPWDPHGIATLEATGEDRRSALEVGLHAVLTLALGPSHAPASSGRSAPIQGEGDDLANLFADMADDLLGQIEHFGNGLHDIVVDGVVHRAEGGYVGWGYAMGPLEAAPPSALPRLLSGPTAVDEGRRVIIRARLSRQ